MLKQVGVVPPDGELRHQFHHVIDRAPTLLEVAHLPHPRIVHGVEQQPIEGVSMADTFDDPAAPDRHETQYFEMLGNRGDVNSLQMGLRTLVIYAATLTLVRLASQRFLNKVSAFDVVVAIMLGSIMSRGINGWHMRSLREQLESFNN